MPRAPFFRRGNGMVTVIVHRGGPDHGLVLPCVLPVRSRSRGHRGGLGLLGSAERNRGVVHALRNQQARHNHGRD